MTLMRGRGPLGGPPPTPFWRGPRALGGWAGGHAEPRCTLGKSLHLIHKRRRRHDNAMGVREDAQVVCAMFDKGWMGVCPV